MSTYYNEHDRFAAQWLRNLIAAKHIPAGDVDDRDIRDVQPDDLTTYIQCHFFAGIGGWAYAARLAGWPDHRELWTGSCPCQSFSVAGRGKGHADDRHLWPEFFRHIAALRPALVMGEQVAAAAGRNWLDGVFADLENAGYACRAAVVPACAVNAPHRRERLWFVAHTERDGFQRACPVGLGPRRRRFADLCASFVGADGKSRRIKPGVRLLAHGVPARVGRLRAYGNAIVPQVAAEIIAAWMDCAP